MLKKKIGANVKSKPLDQAAAGWNDSTTTAKYFDVNVDIREKRAVQARLNEQAKMSSTSAKIIKQSGNAI